MGLLDRFRKKPLPTATKPAGDGGAAVRDRFGADAEAAFRAFDPRLADERLSIGGVAPFEWVEATVRTGGVMSRLRLVGTEGRVIEVNGVDGFRALLAQGAKAGLPFEELVAQATEHAYLKIHTSRAVVAGLCSPSPAYETPGSALFLERFQPPYMDGKFHVFCAEASPRPFVIMGRNRADLVRVIVDRETLAVTAESLGSGPAFHPPKIGGPGGLVQPGRALVADDGAVITAARLPSSTTGAAWWRRQALGEHASIASFSRAGLELMAIGAPLDLLERLHAAAIDEIRHARQCLAIAKRLDGAKRLEGAGRLDHAGDADGADAIGPLPALAPRPGTRAEIAWRTLLEAAIPETIAAALLRRAAEDAADDIRPILLQQADDEARHAALAWDIVAWCGGVDEIPERPVLDDDHAGDARAGIPSPTLREHVLAAVWPEIQVRLRSR